MGYTRIIQSGDYLEVYSYSKRKNDVRRYGTVTKRKRSRKSTAFYRRTGRVFFRSDASIKRSKAAFFRLVATNLHGEETPTFITLTYAQAVDVEIAYMHLRAFFKRLRDVHGKHIRYIAVPEWQPVSGRIHFHCVVFGLKKEDVQGEDPDRHRRNFQRLWLRGYVDVRLARDASIKIAGYMAKYMAKASDDSRLYNIRAYSASNNCKRPNSAGSNALIDYLDDIKPVDSELLQLREYDTMWLGRCTYQQFKV